MANKILRLSERDLRVDFQTEITSGLVLCPSDPNDSNFMIDGDGNLWAIDFGRTSFLPPSFVSYSLRMSSDIFVRSIARYIIHPPSTNLRAMCAASGRLVIFNTNDLGMCPWSTQSRHTASLIYHIGAAAMQLLPSSTVRTKKVVQGPLHHRTAIASCSTP